MSNQTKIILIIIVISLGLLGLRVIMVRPTVIIGDGHIDKVLKRGATIEIILREGIKSENIAKTDIFKGLKPNGNLFLADNILGKAQSQSFEKDSSYSEYIYGDGRLRICKCFEYGEHGNISGETFWLEYYPNSLSVDSFFSRDISKHIDVSKKNTSVYINNKTDHTYMTTVIAGNQIKTISWLPGDK
jgi:hypothetical protein